MAVLSVFLACYEVFSQDINNLVCGDRYDIGMPFCSESK